MNFNKIIEPFTAAVCRTTDVPMPTEALLLSEKARRFLADNVMSEMIEFVLATNEADQIDAAVDAIIYITDTCLRFGIDPEIGARYHYSPGNPVNKIWDVVKDFVRATTLQEQEHKIVQMLTILTHYTDLELTPFVEEVARANNQKIVDGLVVLNEKGKVMKPEGFVAPDLNKILKEVRNG